MEYIFPSRETDLKNNLTKDDLGEEALHLADMIQQFPLVTINEAGTSFENVQEAGFKTLIGEYIANHARSDPTNRQRLVFIVEELRSRVKKQIYEELSELTARFLNEVPQLDTINAVENSLFLFRETFEIVRNSYPV